MPGKTDSLTYGGAHKCSEEANCDTPIVYETYIQGLLQCYSINVIMHMRCKKMHEPKSSILSLKFLCLVPFIKLYHGHNGNGRITAFYTIQKKGANALVVALRKSKRI